MHFSLVNFTTKGGKPILSKEMTVIYDETGTIDNVLTVTLESLESVNLFGKYIYQITIQDRDGRWKSPARGLCTSPTTLTRGSSDDLPLRRVFFHMKEEKPDEHNLLSELCGGECVWVQG